MTSISVLETTTWRRPSTKRDFNDALTMIDWGGFIKIFKFSKYFKVLYSVKKLLNAYYTVLNIIFISDGNFLHSSQLYFCFSIDMKVQPYKSFNLSIKSDTNNLGRVKSA